ncbi:hypothetical protein C8A03DRAFT_39710, partial [Achaetomium macrosporum]
ELSKVATLGEGEVVPVVLLPRYKVSKVDPQLGATLEDGGVIEADVIIGADVNNASNYQGCPAVPHRQSSLPIRDATVYGRIRPRDGAADDRGVVMYLCQNNKWLTFVCIHPETESHIGAIDEWNGQASLDQANSATIKVWQLLDLETLDTRTSGKLALMGDAAHPYQAQGGAQALEDVATLAAVLPQGTKPAQVPDRVKVYESIRR